VGIEDSKIAVSVLDFTWDDAFDIVLKVKELATFTALNNEPKQASISMPMEAAKASLCEFKDYYIYETIVC